MLTCSKCSLLGEHQQTCSSQLPVSFDFFCALQHACSFNVHFTILDGRRTKVCTRDPKGRGPRSRATIARLVLSELQKWSRWVTHGTLLSLQMLDIFFISSSNFASNREIYDRKLTTPLSEQPCFSLCNDKAHRFLCIVVTLYAKLYDLPAWSLLWKIMRRCVDRGALPLVVRNLADSKKMS